MNTQTCVDFGRSFICGDGSTRNIGPVRNDVRFWIESVLYLYDDLRGTRETFYQCGSCKSENTFDAAGPGDLFKKDNYDFVPIVGEQKLLAFSRKAVLDDYPYKSVRSTDGHPWGTLRPKIVHGTRARRLDDFAAIAAASKGYLPLIGRTVLSNPQLQLRAEIEYPIKTLNILFNPDVYQVDTGPVLFADLSRRCDDWTGPLSLAYVAYETRTCQFADFILETPLPIERDGKIVCTVMHYSKTVTCPADNSLWSISP